MSEKSTSKITLEVPFDLEKVFSPNNFSKLSKWQQEVISFYARRLEFYSKVPEQLAKCQNPQDVYELQAQFFTKLFSDYRSEAAVISELLFDMSLPVVEKIQASPEAGYEETILKAQEDAEKILSLAKDQAEMIVEAAEARAASLSEGEKKSDKVA
ncbi:MAG: phasin family protein [Desulfobulbia bacterium]